MAYSTATSILTMLPGLAQTTTDVGYTATVALITQHIERSDNEINAKIATRYDITNFASSVPPLLKTLSEDIASYYTYRSFFSADNQNNSEWLDRFKDALAQVNEIRDGDMDLVDVSGNVVETRDDSPTGVEYVSSNTMNYASTFDEGKSIDWKIDDDKNTDILGSK